MNPANSKTSDPRRLLLNLSDKLKNKLNGSDKYVALSNLSIYEKNKFKISAPTWNDDEFESTDGSYLYQIFNIILRISIKK